MPTATYDHSRKKIWKIVYAEFAEHLGCFNVQKVLKKDQKDIDISSEAEQY